MAWTNEELAARVAADIGDGWYVNLGIGLPTLVAECLHDRPVVVHSENGILGVGPAPASDAEDPDVIGPSKNPVTIVPGAAFIDSLMSFSIIRGGHLDLSVMGAYQVSANGDIANWRLPARRVGGIGGAADLAAGARRVWVITTHTTQDGQPKLVRECSYPLTAIRVVTRVYTDLAVLSVDGGRFRALRLAPGVTVDELRDRTGAEVELAG